jgi:hypothetical protein
MSMKNSNDTIENRTHDLLACTVAELHILNQQKMHFVGLKYEMSENAQYE